MYHEEHPLEIALAWTLVGALFSVYFFTKLGAFNPESKQIDLSPQSQYDHLNFTSD